MTNKELNIELTCILNDIDQVIDVNGSFITFIIDNKKAFIMIGEYCDDWCETMPLFREHGITFIDNRYRGGRSVMYYGTNSNSESLSREVDDEERPLISIVKFLIDILKKKQGIRKLKELGYDASKCVVSE